MSKRLPIQRAGSGHTPDHPFALDDWQLHSAGPESLNVGQLNRAVRMLREELYQQALVKQDLLESLRASVAATDRELEALRLNLGRDPLVMPEWLARARAAIAKAEGR